MIKKQKPVLSFKLGNKYIGIVWGKDWQKGGDDKLAFIVRYMQNKILKSKTNNKKFNKIKGLN